MGYACMENKLPHMDLPLESGVGAGVHTLKSEDYATMKKVTVKDGGLLRCQSG